MYPRILVLEPPGCSSSKSGSRSVGSSFTSSLKRFSSTKIVPDKVAYATKQSGKQNILLIRDTAIVYRLPHRFHTYDEQMRIHLQGKNEGKYRKLVRPSPSSGPAFSQQLKSNVEDGTSRKRTLANG